MSRLSRRIVIRSLLAIVALAPLLLLELCLRVYDYGENQAAASLSAVDRDPLVDLHSLQPLFTLDAMAQRWEIAESRWNYFCPASFPVNKPENGYRVFALGGSTTQGQPYLTETAFPQWLQFHLQAAAPERAVEVINAGGISYASYRIQAILDEVLSHQPDLIVIYMGHNEFLEARTYDRQLLVPATLASPVSRLANLRVVKLWQEWFVQDSAEQTRVRSPIPSEVFTILDQPQGMERYRRDDEWKQAVHRHFELTLSGMLERCRQQQVPVVLCIPASDWLNTMPFKSEPDPELSTEQQAQISMWAERLIDPAMNSGEQLSLAEQILEVDPGYALAHFVVGRYAYQDVSEIAAQARTHLRLAIDHDVCPLRATQVIDQTLRSQSFDEQLMMVDVPALFDRRNARDQFIPDGVPDPEWFVDHVHPTIAGHQVIAEAIFQQLLTSGYFNNPPQHRERFELLQRQHLESLGEEYYGRAAQRLRGVKRWSRQLPMFAPSK